MRQLPLELETGQEGPLRKRVKVSHISNDPFSELNSEEKKELETFLGEVDFFSDEIPEIAEEVEKVQSAVEEIFVMQGDTPVNSAIARSKEKTSPSSCSPYFFQRRSQVLLEQLETVVPELNGVILGKMRKDWEENGTTWLFTQPLPSEICDLIPGTFPPTRFAHNQIHGFHQFLKIVIILTCVSPENAEKELKEKLTSRSSNAFFSYTGFKKYLHSYCIGKRAEKLSQLLSHIGAYRIYQNIVQSQGVATSTLPQTSL
ncbi:MAG TPA: hypothetical protein VJK48_01405 [Chlamydiales bacterium]|nr:hypothetical protein [Chlamydiales bacterium]